MTSKWLRWALCAVLCFVAGCGTRDAKSTSEASEQAYGSVHLPLVTPEQAAFRLRSASFEIRRRGELVVTLDSESNPGASSLDADLLQGDYEITLRDGWRLVREGDAGGDETVPAALLTQNPLAFQVDNGRVTQLVYSFTTEQGVVSFGRGSVSVSVAVGPTPLGACSVLDRASCPNGQTCLFAGDSGQTYCAEPGSLPVGSPCSSEQCVAGAQCLSLDPGHPDDRTCARFCNPESRFCGCQGISVDPGVGVCSAATPAGVVFSHDFVPGDSAVACSEWNTFRNQLGSNPFARVTLAGSRGGAFECDEPAAASQICRALRGDFFNSLSCAGHTWTVSDCAGGPELTVDEPSCGCFSSGGSVRPCASFGFGGVGTDTCAQVPQTIEVSCEPSSTLPSVCGNGVIEPGEACDTNGANPDLLPVGTPFGAVCSASCAAIIITEPVCGNGVIETGEACDTNGAGADVLPAGTPAGSACVATCTAIIRPPPRCGNGIIDAGEACDTNGANPDVLPAGTPAGSVCNATCTAIVSPDSICGNGIIELGEACDTNGANPDVLAAGTPAGALCSSDCNAILSGDPLPVCLSCAQSRCATQFNDAIGVASDPQNRADVTQLFDCVLGPNWQAGGPIPPTSCFFAEPTQPGGSLLPCYCGSTPVQACLATGPANHLEACGVQVEVASRCNPVTASCVFASGSNPAVPLGDALQLLNCERAACENECGFPMIIDE